MVTRELVLWSDTMDGSTAMILAGRLLQIKTVTNYLIRPKNSGFGTGNLVQSYAKRLAAASLFALVHLCDLSWNQIVPSLRLMQSKLINLGFEYYNGNIVISETETEGSQYHT